MKYFHISVRRGGNDFGKYANLLQISLDLQLKVTFHFYRQAADQIKNLYQLFLAVDATQVEVNPFGETPDGEGENPMWLK